jgi:hypothetical protein
VPGTRVFSNWCTILKNSVSVYTLHSIGTGLHTNILATRWRCIGAVGASLHAVIQGQAVVVSTKHRASQFLDGFDGRPGRARGRDVYRYFKVLRALEQPASYQGMSLKEDMGDGAHHPVA